MHYITLPSLVCTFVLSLMTDVNIVLRPMCPINIYMDRGWLEILYPSLDHVPYHFTTRFYPTQSIQKLLHLRGFIKTSVRLQRHPINKLQADNIRKTDEPTRLSPQQVLI